MKLSSILVTIGVLVGLISIYVDRRSTAAQLRAMHEELGRLRVAVPAPEDRRTPATPPTPVALRRPESVPVRAGERADERADEPTPSRPASRAQREAKLNATPVDDFAPIYDVMEAAFMGEAVDTSWAREAGRTARNTLLSHLPEHSRIAALDCRASMCRVESVHESRARADELVRSAITEPTARPWNGSFATGAISEDTRTGSVTLVTYLMREGAELPEPNDAKSAE